MKLNCKMGLYRDFHEEEPLSHEQERRLEERYARKCDKKLADEDFFKDIPELDKVEL